MLIRVKIDGGFEIMICRGKSKTDGEWVKGYLVKYQPTAGKDEWVVGIVPCYASALYIIEVIPETIGECSEQKNSKENKILDRKSVV